MPTEKEVDCKEILDSLDEYISSFDKDWNILYINKKTADDFGFSQSELIGKNFWKLFPRFGGTELQRIYFKVMETKEPQVFEWKTIYAKPSIREFTVSPSAQGVTVHGKDITERKKAEEALVQRTKELENSQKELKENTIQLEKYANQMEQLANQRAKQLQEHERLVTIGQTAGMVGHDIRNPLQAIVGELYLAKDSIAHAPDMPIKKEAMDSLNFVQDQIDYINKIVADLQDYARNTQPTIRDVNIKDLIDTTFSAITIPDNIRANCTVEGKPEVKSDPDYLRRIITNLSNNAIQAMPNGGKLIINVTQKPQLLEIDVTDTGQGIPEEVKDKLFKPLFTTKSKGQGFGLAVVKKFVEQLGGAITFESQEGKGTTFKIELPIK